MRPILNALYDSAAVLAALSMVLLLVTVLSSILGRELHFLIPGTDAYAGYLMAAAGFLALAHTLRRGEHIRVTLVLGALPPKARHRLELFARGLAVVLGGLFAWFSIRLVVQSIEFNDISTSNDATPLWIPQLSMALGSCIFLIALMDDFLIEWQGKTRNSAAQALHE
jgi:TRAP-type C4-dicarboxylate transport system permease small subunit